MDIHFVFIHKQNTISLQFKLKKVAQAGALLSYILNVPSSNFGWGTKYPEVSVARLSPSKKMPM
jgi:hypothetical protein